MNTHLDFGWFSRPGKGGGNNQDRLIGHVPRQAALLSNKGALFVVADGMQGQRAGNVASHLAAQAVLQSYYASPVPDPVQCLRAALGTADGWLRYWAALRPDLSGMGTTLTSVVVRGSELIVAHVGDSRAYLVRGGQTWALTCDHTWVAGALAQGLLTPQEAARHPWRHVLTRYLGGRSPAVDARRLAYSPGDRLVLCSDGVGEFVTVQEIGWLAARSPRQAARALVQIARQRGGRDDASALVVSLGQPARGSPLGAPLPTPVSRQRYAAAAGATALGTPAQQTFLLVFGLILAGMLILLGMIALAGG